VLFLSTYECKEMPHAIFIYFILRYILN